MHSSPRKRASLGTLGRTSPEMDNVSWLAELPLDVKVHIIMYAARAANRPVLGMAVNKLCRKTMLQQQPLKLRAFNLPYAVQLLQSSELKHRQIPLSLEVVPRSQLTTHVKALNMPDNTNTCLTMVTELSCQRISSHSYQTDLQRFTKLQHLNFDICALGSINLAKFADLKSFICRSCSIETLLATGNAALKEINVLSCAITSVIIIQDCPQLKRVYLSSCEVADRIRVNRCPQLEVVECSRFCNLPTLDISQCNQLTRVCVDQSYISNSLCISECINWAELYIQRNSIIIGLDIFKLQQLKELHCKDSEWLLELRLPPSLVLLNCESCPELRTIDASGCSMLKQLHCEGCSKLEQLNLAGCQQLEHLRCVGCSALEQLNLIHCQQLKSLDCKGCIRLRVLELSCTPQLAQLVCHGCDNLKVMNLPTSLISLNYYPCINMTELLNNIPPGLRCLGIQYTARWRDLLQACPLLTQLYLYGSDCSQTLKAGSTNVTIGSRLYGICFCTICCKCTSGNKDDDNQYYNLEDHTSFVDFQQV